jgi:hypothetical protein
MVIGLSAVVGVVPASPAQDPQVLGAGTGTKAEERQTHDELSGGLTPEPREHGGVFVVKPVGKVWVGPELVEGEPSYVRRTTVSNVTVVEVSTTPFMPVLASNEVAVSIGRPDQPAGW